MLIEVGETMKAFLQFNLDQPEDERRYRICNAAERVQLTLRQILRSLNSFDKMEAPAFNGKRIENHFQLANEMKHIVNELTDNLYPEPIGDKK